ncbi:unnamed protein product [Musa acuminata var. zebrina]
MFVYCNTHHIIYIYIYREREREREREKCSHCLLQLVLMLGS